MTSKPSLIRGNDEMSVNLRSIEVCAPPVPPRLPLLERREEHLKRWDNGAVNRTMDERLTALGTSIGPACREKKVPLEVQSILGATIPRVLKKGLREPCLPSARLTPSSRIVRWATVLRC